MSLISVQRTSLTLQSWQVFAVSDFILDITGVLIVAQWRKRRSCRRCRATVQATRTSMSVSARWQVSLRDPRRLSAPPSSITPSTRPTDTDAACQYPSVQCARCDDCARSTDLRYPPIAQQSIHVVHYMHRCAVDNKSCSNQRGYCLSAAQRCLSSAQICLCHYRSIAQNDVGANERSLNSATRSTSSANPLIACDNYIT